MATISGYNVIQYSGFDERFKEALMIASHSLDTDYNTLLTVITGKLPLVRENPIKLPQHPTLMHLGAGIEYPIIKIRMHVKQYKEMCGRVIFLFDKSTKNIFFIDIYIKKRIKNHDITLIQKAYEEYCKIIETK